jgi:hypothetical protein
VAACRHADFCPFPANTASPVTELDTAIHRLRPAPRPPEPGRIALHFELDLFVYRSHTVPEAGPRHLSPTENSPRQLPSCTPHSFLSGSGPFTPFPHRTSTCRMCFQCHRSMTHFIPPPCWALLSILRKSYASPAQRRERNTRFSLSDLYLVANYCNIERLQIVCDVLKCRLMKSRIKHLHRLTG